MRWSTHVSRPASSLAETQLHCEELLEWGASNGLETNTHAAAYFLCTCCFCLEEGAPFGKDKVLVNLNLSLQGKAHACASGAVKPFQSQRVIQMIGISDWKLTLAVVTA